MADENNVSLYVRIRQFFQPYYRPKPKDAVKKSKKLEDNPAPEVEKQRSVNGDTALRVSVRNYPAPLTQAINFSKKPKPDHIWCYHDANCIQVFACFNPGSGFRYPSRDDAARKKLKPLFYPELGKAFDRTHLIPIGYHGSESDNRLLVGWDPDQNRNQMAEFEKQVKNLKFPIYWLTSIDRKPNGAEWHYRIFDARNPDAPSLVKKLDLELNCPFTWKG